MRTQRQELKIIHKGNKILVYTKDELKLLQGKNLVKKWIITTLIISAFIILALLMVLNIIL